MTATLFEVKPDPQSRMTYRVVEQLALRVEGIMSHFPRAVAALTLERIVNRAPDDLDDYPDLIELYRYQLPGWASTIGIMIPSSSHQYRLRSVDAKRTVMYVQPKLIRGQADPAAVVLWRSNPWTMDTLPYEPSPKEAKIISRRVSDREVTDIEKMRRAGLPAITAELTQLGKTVERPHPTLLKRKVERDLAFEILRREFGVGDAPHVPHWRPAIRLARGVFTDRVMKQFLRWLTSSSEQGWKKGLLVDHGKASDIQAIQDFQQHVAGAGQ